VTILPLSSLTPALSSLPLVLSLPSPPLPLSLSPSRSLAPVASPSSLPLPLSPEVAQCGRPPSPLPLPPSRSTIGPCARPAQGRAEAWPCRPVVLIFPPLPLSCCGRSWCSCPVPVGLGGAAVGTEQSQVLPFSLVFWDFAFASLIRPFYDFDSCSRVWPRMPLGFSFFS